MTKTSRLRACMAGLALLLSAPLLAPPGAAAPVAAAELSPVLNIDGGVTNVAFYYGGTLRLADATPDEITNLLGHPSVVVANTNDRVSVDTASHIKSIGAEPYQYLQYYWAPGNGTYEGINLQQHPDQAFCLRGSRPLVGRTVNGVKWSYIDTNENQVRRAIRTRLEQLKLDGWTGVMFDRGHAATVAGVAPDGTPLWSAKSTCTQRPHTRGATFSDSYVSMVALAHEVGLKVMFNNGISPFESMRKMRPDPSSRACREGRWSSCRTLGDVWPKADLILNEIAVAPRAGAWQRHFDTNRASERDVAHGHRVVALITTAAVGGAANQTPPSIYYAWSRIKLFNLAVAINTGDGVCTDTATAPCNRFGTYPELVDIDFGKPVASRPSSSSCSVGSTIHCVWSRQYARGMNVLNVGNDVKNETLSLGVTGCRYVYDVFAKAPLANNTCVEDVTLQLEPWSGRPLIYSSNPW